MAVCNYFNPDNRVFRAADTLSEQGYEVQLLAYHKEGLEKRETPGHGFTITRISLTSPLMRPSQLANFFRYNNFKKKAKKFADKLQPDVVHCHDYNTLFLGVYCKKKFGSKIVYDDHEYFQDLTYLHRYPKILRKYIAWYERKTIKQWVDEMIVVSDGIAMAYHKLTGKKPVVIRNIPDFKLDISHKKSTGDPFHLKEAKEKGEELLLYLGTNFSRGRGLVFISKMLITLPENYKLVVFGCKDDREVTHLNQLFAELQLKNRVRIFKFISLEELSQMGSHFSYGLSIIEPIYFSYKHSLPNKLFEYVMMGIPVIVSDIPEQAKLVQHYDIGLIASLDQPEQLSVKILNEKTDKTKAIKKAQTELNWQEEKKKLISLYSLMIDG
jgi:glycosyltransferase involved in cell wall biosynthesis